MALPAIIDQENYNTLDEALQSQYVEKDGKFFLDVTPIDGYSLNDDTSLRKSLSRERENVKTLNVRVAKFGDLDPEVARNAISRIEELANADPDKETEAKLQAMKDELVQTNAAELKKFETDVEAKDERIGVLTKEIERLLVDAQATAALSAAGGSVKLLLPHLRSQIRVVESEGKFSTEVLDPDTGTAALDSKGEPVDVASYVESMKSLDDFAPAFKGSGASGSGANTNQGHTTHHGAQIVLSAADAKNQATYRAAKAEAARTGKELVFSDSQ